MASHTIKLHLPRYIYLLLLPFLLLHLYYYSHPFTSTPNPTPTTTTRTITIHTTTPPPLCNFSQGTWVPTTTPPLYNSTCTTIKAGQNCISHGRPDTSYLYYHWQPTSCDLPRFDPPALLHLLRHRHLLFVGDSLARNQLESLLCLLSSHSPPILLSDDPDHKNRRWLFPTHNLTVSIFWSPFLVRGVEKSPTTGVNHNVLYVDEVDDRWAAEIAPSADVIVLSVGHWFLHRAVYHDASGIVGCHSCDGMNHTEVGFYEVYGRAFRTALSAVIGRRRRDGLVVVTTFSPAHFEGDWDGLAACNMTEPYGDEVETRWMDAEMRRRQLIEVEEARRRAGEGGDVVKVEALDVTRMAMMRPDGHPGPYMYPFPFKNGVPDRLPNDCVHWCLPGPIDVWNEVLLLLVKWWRSRS